MFGWGNIIMAKKVKVFSPYNYGIKYRVPGKNPFQKYTYVPSAGGGGTEPVYVVTKRTPNFFTFIVNNWYFDIDDFGNIKFLKCDSDINISTTKIGQGVLIEKNVSSSLVSTKLYVKKEPGNNYFWENDRTVRIAYLYNVTSDLVILLNNEYYNEYCKIKVSEGSYFEITFNRDITHSDNILMIIYPITYSKDHINNSFSLNEVDTSKRIYDSVLGKTLITNDFGIVDYKYVVINKNNEIYPITSFNVEPSYIEIDNKDLVDENEMYDVARIYSYTPNNYIETFIIQYGINSGNISWTGNIVKINHNLNGEVNYILDRNDYRKMIKSIRRLNADNIEIEFYKDRYLPNVFSITIFKIGEF